MDHNFFVRSFDPVIKIKVWDIRSDKHHITALKSGYMFANMACAAGSVNKYQLKFRVEMPKKEVTQIGIHHQPQGAVVLCYDLLQFRLHADI